MESTIDTINQTLEKINQFKKTPMGLDLFEILTRSERALRAARERCLDLECHIDGMNKEITEILETFNLNHLREPEKETLEALETEENQQLAS